MAALPAHGKDKKKKHHDSDAPTQSEQPAPPGPPGLPGNGLRETPGNSPGVSLDHVIEQVEKRHSARVVRYETSESDGRRLYVLRLLSDQGRVWTVKVDAETGKEL